MKQDASCCYWPERKGASVTYGKLRVTVVSVDYNGDVVIHKLEVTQDKPSTETPAVRTQTQLSLQHLNISVIFFALGEEKYCLHCDPLPPPKVT